MRVGHKAEQGALRACAIAGRARFGSDGAKYSLQGHEVTLQNFLESPAITSNEVAVTERDVEALAARPDGELAVIVTRNPEASGEAGVLFLGRIGSTIPRGVYHFRACRYEFTDEIVGITEKDLNALNDTLKGIPASEWATELQANPENKLIAPDGRYYHLDDRRYYDHEEFEERRRKGSSD